MAAQPQPIRQTPPRLPIDYVGDISVAPKCSLCQQVIRDAYLCIQRIASQNTCFQSFCHPCLEVYIDQHGGCPNCGLARLEDDFRPNTTINQVVDALQVYCRNRPLFGCPWQGERHLLDQHSDIECGFRPVTCVHCDQRMTFDQLVTHEPHCQYRPYQCQQCGMHGIQERYRTIHDQERCWKQPTIESLMRRCARFEHILSGLGTANEQSRQVVREVEQELIQQERQFERA